MDINIRIAGEAGQGVVSFGETLVGAFAETGLQVFSGKGYMSRIRGGLNWYDVRIGDSELFALREKSDLLIALNPTALKVLRNETTPEAFIILNGKKADAGSAIDFSGIAEEIGGHKVMGNAVAAGTVFGLLQYPVQRLYDYLEKEFGDKGKTLVKRNKKCAEAGYKLTEESKHKLKPPKPGKASGKVTAGAAALGLGSATAGVKLATAYPMTPATATFTFLAQHADKYRIMVEQAEDELAAINMACGGAYAGAPVMTMTSGGGFALMCEGLSLAGMMELPVFVMIAQRPGPATGLPTRTAQEDLKFAVNAGHGEFPRAVYAPGTIEQCYHLARRALETAHRFQTPAIMLTDQYLQDVKKNIVSLDGEYNPIDRNIGTRKTTNYQRYEDAENGISRRAIPGGGAFVVSDSDEHFEDGHLTEDFETRIMQQNKRMRKVKGLKKKFIDPEIYGSKNAKTYIVCWGSTYGPCRELVDSLNSGKSSAAMVHFSQVWPLPGKKLKNLLEKPKKVIVVENNYTGQFRALLREAGVSRNLKSVNRYDGLPFTCDYLLREVKK
jgi:2-oxoglutarate ferredoxin oxidoreductase subunit alpha